MANTEALDSPVKWVADHTRQYVESDGVKGHEWRGVRCLVLTTTGRRSGAKRRNALIYGRDGDRYIVVASKGGHPQHPAWYLNLVANPTVEVQVGADRFRATARSASADEKADLWSQMAAIWPYYKTYQAKTAREIPLVILDPAG